MSEPLQDLETRLRSWTPRQPSPKIKRRLWAAGPALCAVGALAENPFPAFRLGWLAPATMALLLSCAFFNQRNGAAMYTAPDCGPLVASAMSNRGTAAWLPGSFQRQQNSPPTESFEWTNSRQSTSSFPAPRPNSR